MHYDFEIYGNQNRNDEVYSLGNCFTMNLCGFEKDQLI